MQNSLQFVNEKKWQGLSICCLWFLLWNHFILIWFEVFKFYFCSHRFIRSICLDVMQLVFVPFWNKISHLLLVGSFLFIFSRRCLSSFVLWSVNFDLQNFQRTKHLKGLQKLSGLGFFMPMMTHFDSCFVRRFDWLWQISHGDYNVQYFIQ